MGKTLLAAAAAVLVPILGLGLAGGGLIMFVVLLGGGGGSSAAVSSACQASAVAPVRTSQLGEVAGYEGAQLRNAAQIMRAGKAAGISRYGQTIGVMTAMGESTLRVLDHGDTAGPDSRGLFQQRANGAWGSYADRMDPYTSATNFFEALKDVAGWEALEPTIAAHKVQRNRDPYHYTRYWEPATKVVAALSGGSVPATELTQSPCEPLYSGVISDTGWVHPIPGFTTFWDNYGVDRGAYTHAGEDFGAPAGHPILAAATGTVTHVSCRPWRGRSPCNVQITHGHDERGRLVQTLYVHMYPEGVYVQEGEEVQAGQKIAGVGTNGNSTGYHLHFEVWVDGSAVAPVSYMASVGIDLRNPEETTTVNAPPGCLQFKTEEHPSCPGGGPRG